LRGGAPSNRGSDVGGIDDHFLVKPEQDFHISTYTLTDLPKDSSVLD
jgi:hypothetical protein